MQLNSTEIAELIKKRIAQFNVVTEARNEGTIVSVSDGIVRIHGLCLLLLRESSVACLCSNNKQNSGL